MSAHGSLTTTASSTSTLSGLSSSQRTGKRPGGRVTSAAVLCFYECRGQHNRNSVALGGDASGRVLSAPFRLDSDLTVVRAAGFWPRLTRQREASGMEQVCTTHFGSFAGSCSGPVHAKRARGTLSGAGRNPKADCAPRKKADRRNTTERTDSERCIIRGKESRRPYG